MNASHKLLALFLVFAGFASIGAAWAVVEYRNRPRQPEYVDSPFTPASPNMPRIIPVAEYPTGQDKAAVDKWRAENNIAREYVRKNGGIKSLSEKEREAFLAILDANDRDRDGYVKARDLANKILDADPNSAIGHYVMAQVEHYGESNLPRALFEIRQARRLLEQRGKANPDDADAREWYIQVLYEEYRILNAMDRREEQLRVVDLLEQVYQPMPWLRLFALIKMQNLDEVERLLEIVEKDGRWPLRVLNTRTMVAEQRRDRAGQYKVSKDMTQKITKSGVLWLNFGGACISDFRLDEAEAAYRKSVTVDYDFYNSAYFPLSGLHVQKAEMKEAWQALRQGQAQRLSRQPHTLEQDFSAANRATALVLLATGRGEEATRFARLAFERPGRVGSTTNTEQDDNFSNGFLMWLALETRIAQLEEISDTFDPKAAWEIQTLRTESWSLRQQLTKILGDTTFLKGIMRPYLPGQASVDSWQLGSILTLLPAGVAEEALNQARSEEQHPAAAAYFDAMAAELAFLRGNDAEAVTLAKQALDKLPAVGEKLLRARVSAFAGEAARRLGRTDEAHAFTKQALQDFPQAFRMLGLRIPVRVEDDGSPQAREIATQILRSPRFRQGSTGFPVQIRTTGDKVEMKMSRAENEVHVQFDIATSDGTAKAVSRFHDRVMSPLLDLTAVEINSLERK